MQVVIQVAVASTAALFIALSATMNALFLSSLGRTPVEVCLLAAVSFGSDVVKAVLPVLVVRAVIARAWGHCAIASLLLAIVVALSMASGTGFAALTRNSANSIRVSQADALRAHQKEFQDAEAAIGKLGTARQTPIIEASIAALMIDRRWTLSKFCSDVTTASLRKFCGELAALRSELAIAVTRDRLTAERRGTRRQIETLEAAGAGGESDPQAAAVAVLFGVDPSIPRRVLPIAVAVVLELGSVILVLLLAGPTVRRWRDPAETTAAASEITAVAIPVSVPHPPDMVGWQLRRNASKLSENRGGSHAR